MKKCILLIPAFNRIEWNADSKGSNIYRPSLWIHYRCAWFGRIFGIWVRFACIEIIWNLRLLEYSSICLRLLRGCFFTSQFLHLEFNWSWISHHRVKSMILFQLNETKVEIGGNLLWYPWEHLKYTSNSVLSKLSERDCEFECRFLSFCFWHQQKKWSVIFAHFL